MTYNKQLNIDCKQICSLNDVSAFLCDLKTEEPIIRMVVSETNELTKPENSPKYSYERSEMLLNYVWEKLNTGHWSNVNVAWRQMYSALSVLKVIFTIEVLEKISSYSDYLNVLKDLLKMCDVGCLMGAPIMNNVCSRLATFFNKTLNHNNFETLDFDMAAPKKRKFENPLHSFKNLESICEIDELSLEQFVSEFKQKEKPIKITNTINHWPAIDNNSKSQWNMEYFGRTMGHRTVPIEIGNRYTDLDWTQTLMTTNTFIKEYVLNSNPKSVGYLAQHELFNQIPELSDDFDIPLYCYSGENDEDISINMWLGPSNTVSPMHTDPKHNCLCQVFGQKYVRLYTSNQTEFLYPYDPNDMLSNTSQIDLDQDFHEIVKSFPKFEKAKGYECIIGPGDILYIPPKCWHFVKSLSNSCSLSFWFD